MKTSSTLLKSVENQPLLMSSSQKSSKISLIHVLLGLSWCVICLQLYVQQKSSVEIPLADSAVKVPSFRNYDLDSNGVFYAGDPKCDMATILEIQEWKWRYWYLGYVAWNNLTDAKKETESAKAIAAHKNNPKLPEQDTRENAHKMFEVHLDKFKHANELYMQTMHPFAYPNGTKQEELCNAKKIQEPCGPNPFQWRTHMLRSPEGVNLRCSSSMHPCKELKQPDEKWFADATAYPDGDSKMTEEELKKHWWYPLKVHLDGDRRERFKKCNTVESWCNVVGLKCYDRWSGLRLKLWTKAGAEAVCIGKYRDECKAEKDKPPGV